MLAAVPALILVAAGLALSSCSNEAQSDADQVHLARAMAPQIVDQFEATRSLPGRVGHL